MKRFDPVVNIMLTCLAILALFVILAILVDVGAFLP